MSRNQEENVLKCELLSPFRQ